jgi:hypothetical protein
MPSVTGLPTGPDGNGGAGGGSPIATLAVTGVLVGAALFGWRRLRGPR